MTYDELAKTFEQLSESEKLAAVKQIMPSICELFRKDPQRMMVEMMPLCREMMQECDFDPQMMMQMMTKMRQPAE